jgi:tetratricopeptide (TPR) repeat protein
MADSPSELHAEIEKLERKHAEHPEGRYFVPLANAYRKLGDVEHAENLLRDGLRRHPDYLSAHIVLGRCLADRSATREASDEFRYVLSFDPQNLIALRTLGELAAAEGRSAEAERWYEELLAVDPMNDEARRALESLRGAAAVPEVEEEFRPDAAWWEREPELEEEPVTAQEPEMRHEPGAAQEPEAAAVDDSPAWCEPPDEEPVADRPDEEETAGNHFGGSEGSDPEEVVTETIAELYARQGFHERAAGVYRELIRRRGGDPVLERRLAEMESRMGGAEPTLPPPEPTPEHEPELPALQDTFATSFADGFFAADEERDDEPDMTEQPPEPEPVLEPESIAEPEPIPAPAPAAASERETIGSYLRALIAWTPGAEESVEFSPVEEAPSSPEAELEPEPEREPEPWPEPEEAADLQPVQPQRLAEEPESEPAPGPAAPEEPGTGRAEADLFPWELPMDSAPRTTWVRTPEPESRPAPAPLQPHEEEDFFSFDAFFSDEPSGGAPGKGATPAPEAKPEPAAEEDDDLESFQAWLRSLKR